jgi:dihydrofolate reductase
MISAIAALGKNRVIGKNNELLWHIPDDLKRFKSLTMGHPVIIGRKTFESIVSKLGKPLPGRTNIVVTRDAGWSFDAEANSVLVAHSVKDAIEKGRAIGSKEVFIGGGAQVYEQAFPFVDRLYLTLIDDEKEGDAYFPAYETIFTKKIKEETRTYDALKYTWIDLEK